MVPKLFFFLPVSTILVVCCNFWWNITFYICFFKAPQTAISQRVSSETAGAQDLLGSCCIWNLERTVGTTLTPLGATVISSLLVHIVVGSLLWAIVRGKHQRLLFRLIIKWRTDKQLSSDPSCGTESMRRLSGRINQRTSFCLQSFMALCCLCSGGGGETKKALLGTGKKYEPALLRDSTPLSTGGYLWFISYY